MEQKTTASNGVDIYSYKLPNTHSVCISLYIKTGTLYESRNPGITHFLEHLHFRRLGGRTQKELYDQLESIGAYLGASTYKELMQFYVTASPSYFSNIAKIISDLLGELEADSIDFSREKKIILSEIREDNQKNDVDLIADKFIWQNTALQNPVLGTISSIRNLTLQNLKEEKEKAFTKQNLFFYVTGNFKETDISQLVKEVERYDLSKRPDILNYNYAEIPDGFQNRNAFVKLSQRGFPMHDVKIAFDIDFRKVSRCDLIYLDSILSGGLCSLLREEIIEKKGLIYSFSSTIEQYANIGIYSFKFEVYKSKLMETINSFLSVIKRVKQDVSEKEMSTVRIFKTDNQMSLLDDPEDLNWTFGYENHILNHHYLDISNLSDAYRSIDKVQIVKTAGEIFQAKNVSLITIGNKKGLSEMQLHETLSELD